MIWRFRIGLQCINKSVLKKSGIFTPLRVIPLLDKGSLSPNNEAKIHATTTFTEIAIRSKGWSTRAQLAALFLQLVAKIEDRVTVLLIPEAFRGICCPSGNVANQNRSPVVTSPIYRTRSSRDGALVTLSRFCTSPLQILSFAKHSRQRHLQDSLSNFIKRMAFSPSWPSSAKITPTSWLSYTPLENVAVSLPLSIFTFLAKSWNVFFST